MPLAVTALPIIYCDEYTRCETITLSMPFGLPEYKFNDPCCKGLDTLALDLGQTLSPLMPFLNLLDCIVKLVEIVLAVPDAIGPPPSAMEVMKIGGKITKFIPCVLNLAKMAPLPTNALDFAKFVLSLVRILISILRCLKRVFKIQVDIRGDILKLGASDDEFLQRMGQCLIEQNLALGQNVKANIEAILNIFNLVNAFVGIILVAIPPLKSRLEEKGAYPITPSFSVDASPLDLSGIDSTIAILQFIEVIASALAGGG